MTLIFKQAIKLCSKDTQSDVKHRGGKPCARVFCGCVCAHVCVCKHVYVVMQKKKTKCMFTCSIGMLNIGSVMQL